MAEHTPHPEERDFDLLPADAPAELPLPPLPRPPFWMVALALVSVVATWLPLALIARARVSQSTQPRIQIMQDMGVQPKYREQETNILFADDRADRPKVPGTVARGDVEADDHYYRGFTRDAAGAITFYDSFPAQTPVNDSLIKRGQNRFNIYCYVCHGYDGSGHGPVNQQAMTLQANGVAGMTWTPAANLTADAIRAEPDGKIFNTITNGIRSMPSYGAQIPVRDRWAIVSYVRALQLSQNAPQSLLPPEKLSAMQAESAAPPTTQPTAK